MQRCVAALLLSSSITWADGETQRLLYRPFVDQPEQMKPLITQRLQGTCWQQSQRILREDAWRCQVETTVYDPCFINPYEKPARAVCPVAPWKAESVQIDLASVGDNAQHKPLDMSRTYPWAIELNNGERCLAIDAGKRFDNMPIHYQCTNQKSLFGYLQRCRTQWSMLQVDANGHTSTVLFNKVWF